MLDYPALSALAAVAREGSFERAALALHVTPSAVSQRIRLLEERVGCALVVREQPCRATDTGRRLCQHLDRVRLLEQELQVALPALAPRGTARVTLPIAVNADSLATWFAPVLAAYAADAPVLVELAVDDQDHTAAWLRSGAVLAAVTGSARPATGCNSRPLGAMRYLAVASPGFVSSHFAGGVGAGSLAQAP
ncbi:MAG: ArgP/LysG family DNA-binding transcriptional regulator, partial [Rubrivivax sp.]|nr:ArgP/LysG family DNA-binding transcriptional regulator [Rubrivivax sp.]